MKGFHVNISNNKTKVRSKDNHQTPINRIIIDNDISLEKEIVHHHHLVTSFNKTTSSQSIRLLTKKDPLLQQTNEKKPFQPIKINHSTKTLTTVSKKGNRKHDKNVSPYAVLSFFLGTISILALFISGVQGISIFILLSLFAFILGAVGLVQIINKPEEFKGIGYAIIGIAIGILGLILLSYLILNPYGTLFS